MRPFISLIIGFAPFAALAQIAPANAAEIKIMAPRAIWTVLKEAGPEFERASGHKLNLSVDLAASLITREYIAVGDEVADITPAGTRFLTEFGIDLSALSSNPRPFCRLCLDWTERRPHIAGAVGAALTKRCFDLGWTERMKHSSAVIVTASGKHGFRETFGIGMPEETGNVTRGQ